LSLRSLSGTDARGQFDLELGEVYGSSNSTATIEHYGNGWYRCSMSFSGTNNAHYFYPNIQGTADSGYIYIYGSQIESGSYLTSYTPTTTATVTRSAETANGAGTSDDFNDSEGVLYAEISALADDLTNRAITISDGGITNKITMFYTNVSNAIQVKVVVGGSNSLNDYITIPNISLYNKFALKYKQNDFSLFVNGFELITDTSGNTFSNGTLTELAFDRGDAAEDFYGKTKEVSYFKTALTDSELEALTSWDSFNDMATGQLYSIK
jgi:hypothetical protein